LRRRAEAALEADLPDIHENLETSDSLEVIASADAGRPPSNADTLSGIQSGSRSAKRGFFIQAGILTSVMVVMFAGLLTLSDKAPHFIPFKWEQALSNMMTSAFPLPFKGGTDEISQAWSRDLQILVDDLAKQMDMPEDIKIHVNYSPTNDVNAVAVMGGEVYVFDGLINLARSENALAFVLAHEIAHLKLRHGLRGVGRSGVMSSAILMLFGTSGDVSTVAQQSTIINGLKYSRDMETQADEEAVGALARHYGHVAGMGQIFEDFKRMQRDTKLPPEILRSHPDFVTRLDHMNEIAAARNYRTTGELTPMAFSMSIADDAEKCTKSATLCRIENSLERIRQSRTSVMPEEVVE
jgi:Zn-dependent protease with chaperone function